MGAAFYYFSMTMVDYKVFESFSINQILKTVHGIKKVGNSDLS